MTAVAATALAPEPRWTPPLSPAAYDRRVALSREERRALALIADRPGRWPAGVAEALARFTAPINDVLAVAGLKPGSWAGAPTRGDLLAGDGPGADARSGGGIARSGSGRSLPGTSTSASW